MTAWRDIAELSDRKTLKTIIAEEGTAAMTARRLGCSAASVRNALRFHGLKEQKTVRKRI